MGPYKQQLTLSCESSWWRSRESYCQWWTVWWRYEELRRDLSLFKGKGELHMGPLQPLVTWEPENTGDTTTIFQPLKQLESSQHRQTLILPNLDFHFSSNFPSPLSFLHISSHNNHFNYLRANQVNFFISLFLMIKFLFVSDFLFEDKILSRKIFPTLMLAQPSGRGSCNLQYLQSVQWWKYPDMWTVSSVLITPASSTWAGSPVSSKCSTKKSKWKYFSAKLNVAETNRDHKPSWWGLILTILHFTINILSGLFLYRAFLSNF